MQWKYNLWKDPNVEKADKILAVVYIIGTLIFPVSIIIWLIILWLVRGRKLPLIFKQNISFGLLGAIAIGIGLMWTHKSGMEGIERSQKEGWFTGVPKIVNSAKNMVWGKSGKSLDVLLNEHPLVEKGSIKWYFDDTTDPKTVILKFKSFNMSRESAKENLEKNKESLETLSGAIDNERMEALIDRIIRKNDYKITFVVGSQIVKVVDASIDSVPVAGDASFDTFVSNLERPEKDCVGFAVVDIFKLIY